MTYEYGQMKQFEEKIKALEDYIKKVSITHDYCSRCSDNLDILLDGGSEEDLWH